jgi:hypothetical protein
MRSIDARGRRAQQRSSSGIARLTGKRVCNHQSNRFKPVIGVGGQCVISVRLAAGPQNDGLTRPSWALEAAVPGVYLSEVSLTGLRCVT